jgi:N-acetylglutamate synthase-like GNAT family acetyltransferase
MSAPDLQRALEIAHYARRHRGTTFVAAVAEGVSVADLLLDLKLLAAYGLPGVVVAPPEALALARQARQEGLPVAVEIARLDVLSAGLANGQVPVVLASKPEEVAAELARGLSARRLMLIRSHHPALAADPESQGHLTRAEAERRGAGDGPGADQWRQVVAMLDLGIPGVVLLPGRTGCLFEELFTHDGAGVLVGDAAVETVRPATLADAADIHLLLKAEMTTGVVRPVSERQIAATTHEHLVYTIDGLVVGTARLAPWGDWAEMSRFATLPRYRGRGRARVLGEALIARAAESGCTDLFALSIDHRMWRFFESLGLEAIERQALPMAWQVGYDFNRPSRAFHRCLKPPPGPGDRA